MPLIHTPERVQHACASLRSGRDLAGVRDWALQILEEIRRERAALPAVAHPLGFMCIPLHRRGPRGLCLHVWPEAADDAGSPTAVHAHSWTMTSLVLLGEVVNENIAAEVSASPTHRVMRVLSWRGVDRVTPTPRLVRPVLLRRQRLTESSRYRLDAGIFHRTICMSRTRPATLVLGDHRPAIRDLLLGELGKEQYMTVRRHCDTDEVRRTVAGVLAAWS